jgi:hypothetical protein
VGNWFAQFSFWVDYETGDWMFADITNRPELWHLAGFDFESQKRWDANPNNPKNEN